MADHETGAVSTAERVENAALRLFALRGFEGTGIRSIADEAGITLGSLYHYIGTKEELLDRLMRKSMLGLIEPGQQIFDANPDPRSRIIELVDLHVRRHAEDNLLSIVGDAEIRSLTPARRREAVALRDSYESLWETTIREGVEQGYFTVPDLKLATFALLEMCSGVAYWYSTNGRLSLDTISKSFIDMALSLLGAEPALKRKAPGGRVAKRGDGRSAGR
ncbi:MAG: TetR/AcrR family transcriptional regulator [Acidimicrobiales bacterium]